MENFRIQFSNQESRKRFFQELKTKTNSETFPVMSRRLGIPFGRMKLWMIGYRTVPLSLVQNEKNDFKIDLNDFDHKIIDLKKVLKKYSEKGIKKLEEKYGPEARKKIGKLGKVELEKIFRKNKEIRNKWKRSVKNGLKNRFGDNYYSKMGSLGGKASIQKLIKGGNYERQLEKAFRKSFKSRLEFDGQRFRSKKEIEVALLLKKFGIKYLYEKKIFRYFPDFFLSKHNTIIEAVGFDWSPHISRTNEKIERFLSMGYKVIIYTYPNMRKCFEKSGAKIATNYTELDGIFWDMSGKSSAHPGHDANRILPRLSDRSNSRFSVEEVLKN